MKMSFGFAEKLDGSAKIISLIKNYTMYIIHAFTFMTFNYICELAVFDEQKKSLHYIFAMYFTLILNAIILWPIKTNNN